MDRMRVAAVAWESITSIVTQSCFFFFLIYVVL
jgi:hypothetical protein